MTVSQTFCRGTSAVTKAAGARDHAASRTPQYNSPMKTSEREMTSGRIITGPVSSWSQVVSIFVVQQLIRSGHK